MEFNPRLVEAQLSLGRIRPEDMPELAAAALEAGFDGPTTRKMAGLIRPSGWETDQLRPAFMQECSLSLVDKTEASIRIARQLARRILDENLDPLRFQREFFRLWLDADHPTELQELGCLDDYLCTAEYMGQTEDDVRKFALREAAALLRNSNGTET